MMPEAESFYFGNAAADQVGESGWFVGQFISPAIGSRHQTDVELKWGVHQDGERRPRGPEATERATTIAILIQGALRTTLQVDGTQHEVTMRKQGDYLIYGRDVVHSWEAIGPTIVLSVRFPSVDVSGRLSLPDTKYHYVLNTSPLRAELRTLFLWSAWGNLWRRCTKLLARRITLSR
jgi:hypothetical protein